MFADHDGKGWGAAFRGASACCATIVRILLVCGYSGLGAAGLLSASFGAFGRSVAF